MEQSGNRFAAAPVSITSRHGDHSETVGAGERGLTELDTDQLRDLLKLRADAVGDEE